MPEPTVVFDFDGTLALGRGPLHAYARCIGELTDGEIATACSDAVIEFDSGSSDYRDAYDAIHQVATMRAVPAKTLSSAYLASREYLATERAPIVAPEGLREFLTELAGRARLILATNAPDIGLRRALSFLGIEHLLAEVHTDLGKPAGLGPLLARFSQIGPLLAVGDIWRNDLEPAAAIGATTALVGVSKSGNPTFAGETLTSLYPQILQWAAGSTTSTPHTDATLSERQI